MSLRAFVALLSAAAMIGAAAPCAAAAQDQAGTQGAARAGSNAGSSSITPTHAPAKAKPTKTGKSAGAMHHTMPASTTGMGSQGANATGAAANSH